MMRLFGLALVLFSSVVWASSNQIIFAGSGGGGGGADCGSAPTLMCLAGRTGTTNNPTVSLDSDGTVRGSATAGKRLLLVSDTGAVQTRLVRTILGTDALQLGPGDDPLAPFVGGPIINLLVTEDQGIGAALGGYTANSIPGIATTFAAVRARGTFASPTATMSRDLFFIISGAGTGPDNIPSFSSGPIEKLEQDTGATGPDSLPTMFVFETNDAGMSHTVIRTCIRQDGRVQIGDCQNALTSLPADTAKLGVEGDIHAGTTLTEFTVDASGNPAFFRPTFKGTAPTCGTGCASVIGNDRVMDATTSALATSVTVNFSTTLASTPICVASDDSTTITTGVTSVSTTAVTFGLSAGLTGHIYAHCLEVG